MNRAALKKSGAILFIVAAVEYSIMQVLIMTGAVDSPLGSVVDTLLLITVIAPFLYKKFKAEEKNLFLGRSLKESEEKYRLLFEENPNPMWVFDSETLFFLDVNQAACMHYGYGRDEFLGMKITEIRPPEEVPALLQTVRDISPDLQKAGIWRHRKKNGTLMDMEITAKRVDFNGRPSFLVLANDITEKLRSDTVLKNSERQLKTFLNAIPDMAWQKDAEGRIVAANEAFAKASGLSPGVLVGKKDRDLWPEAFAEKSVSDDLMVMVLKESRRFEDQVPAEDGKSLWYETIRTPIFNENGEVTGTIGIAREITDRKVNEEKRRQAEKALLQEKNRMEEILAGIGDGISIQDRNMKILYQNPALKKIIGEHVGEHCYKAYEGKEALCGGCPVAESLTDGKVHTAVRHVVIDGKDVYVENTASPLTDLDGNIVAGIEVVRDITARRAAEEALRDSEAKMKALISASPAAIVALDTAGNVTSWNPAAERIFGWREDEVLGRPLPFVPGDKLAEFQDNFRRVMECGRLSDLELVRRRKDGTPIDVSLSAVPLYGPEGGVSGIMSLLVDITERKAWEKAVVDRSERLAMLNKIDRAMMAAHEFEEVIAVLLESLANALKMESGMFALLDPEGRSITVRHTFNLDKVEGPSCYDLARLPVTSKAIAQNRPMVRRMPAAGSALLGEFGYESMMVLPLAIRDKVEGVLYLVNRRAPHEFTEDEIAFARQVADQAVVAIMNAGLIKDLKDREAALTARNKELAAYNEISSIIAETIDLNEMLQRALDKTLSFYFLELQKKGAIFIRDEKDTDTLLMKAHSGLAPRLLEDEKRIKLGHCLCGTAAQTGEIVESGGCFEDHRHTTSYDGMKDHGHIVLPLKVKNTVLGVMTLYLEPGVKVKPFEKQLLTAIASQLAVAVENRRLFQSILSGKKEWEATFDSIEDVITIHGPDYSILRANRAASRLFRMPTRDIVGRRCFEFFHGSDAPIPSCPAKDLIEGKISAHREEYEAGGRFYEVNVYPVKYGGDLSSIVHVVKDITERKIAQNTLLHRLAVEGAVSEASSLLLSGGNVNLEIILAILGEAIGTDIAHLLLYDDVRGSIREVYGWCGRGGDCGEEKLKSLAPARFQWWVEKMKDQQEVVVEDVSALPDDARAEKEVLGSLNIKSLLAVPLRHEGKLSGFISFGTFNEKAWSKEEVSLVHYAAHDVLSYLERRAAEKALKESEEKFRSLVEQSLAGVYIIQDGVFKYANPRFAEIFEYAGPEEVNGVLKVEDIASPEDKPLVLENVRKRFSGEINALNYTFGGITKNGRGIHVEVFGSNTVYDGRRAVIGTLMDITERVRSQEELIMRERDMAVLQQAKSQLEEINRLKSEFLANMSHELRTPLNAVIGLSNILIEETFGPLAPKQAEYLKGINSSGEHLLSLINEILDLSKIEAGREELERAWFSLGDTLKNSFLLVKEKAMKHKITLQSGIGPEVGMFYGDERRIKQVIFNLLSNAIKFTEPGGRVGITACADGSEAAITVWDTGIGIPENKKHLLFQPFQQLDSALSRKHEGTGLGLVLTKKLVELHGGRITFESREGEGSSFTVFLPLKGGEAAMENREATPDAAGCSVSGKTVLVAEDNELNMLLVSDYLKTKGFTVLEAFDGESALKSVKEQAPDIILLDIQMPGIDGLEVARRLKADPVTRHIPVIAMTALAMKGDEEMCLKSGCDGYIRKPLNLGEMLAVIKRHLSGENKDA